MTESYTDTYQKAEFANPAGYNVEELYRDFSFEVPIYQRVFTWGDEQFERLLKDLVVHFVSSKRSDRYYLGVITVVRQKDNDKLILVDGQQRLTCIMLLGALLGWNLDTDRLTYAARPADKEALEAVYSISGGSEYPSLEEIASVKNTAMAGFMRFALTKGKELLDGLKNESDTIKRSLSLMISFLPRKPYSENIFEQNRYFEKMNYGGKQLEPHEILKVRMCDGLDHRYLSIWNSVSDFGKYYHPPMPDKDNIQMETCARPSLYDVASANEPSQDAESFLLKIYGQSNERLLHRYKEQFHQYEIGSEERDDLRHALISFPVFLLHVRYLYLKKKNDAVGDESHLLDLFHDLENCTPDERGEFVNLMEKYRQFLDSKIIHINMIEGEIRYCFYDEDGVRDLIPDNKKNLMQFQSMLYASSGDNQNWLLDAYEKCEDGSKPLTLDGLAQVVLASTLFDSSIQKQILECGDTWSDDCLAYGANRRWFALLDYLLWNALCKDDKGELWKKLLACEKFQSYEGELRSAIKNYMFRKNRSVEHLHAQTDKKATAPEEWEGCKDMFGNLALISAGKNSEYGNDSVGGKADRVIKLLREGTKLGSKIESIKLLFMLAKCNGEESKWNPGEARSHANDMLKLYREFLSCGCCLEERGNVNDPLSSREDLLRWIVDELDQYMKGKGFLRAKGSKLSDSVLDDKSLYYEKDGVRVVFSTEKEECASMYVGILNEYAGGWNALARVKRKLPNWEQYRTWCWHYLDDGHANWTDEFLMACKSDRTILAALLDEIATLIQEAYSTMKQVKNELSRT